MIPIYQEGAVDPDLLEEGKRNIRERLEREGYFDASVEYASATREVQSKRWKGQEQVITYTIERGDRHKLIGIEITGNQYFDKDCSPAACKFTRPLWIARYIQPTHFGRRPAVHGELVPR